MSEISAHFMAERGDFSLDARFVIPQRGVTALFGHSGSGKTTILRCIAGLEPSIAGELTVAGECWQASDHTFLAPHHRPVGYVFQDANLFAHLNVRKNIEFGLRRIASAKREIILSDVVAMLGIEQLLKRSVERLSGGERQRVAIARALLTSPKLLLMDEPLASLDEGSKAEILPYLERLHDQLSIPVVYVSHSQKEITRIADHVLWLANGRVQAQGALAQVWGRFDLAATQGEDAGEIITTTLREHDARYHLSRLVCACGDIWVKQLRKEIGTEVRVHVPAKDVSLTRQRAFDTSVQNIWPVVVEAVSEIKEGQVMLRLRGAQEGAAPVLLARITLKSLERLELVVGSGCFAQIKSVGLLD